MLLDKFDSAIMPRRWRNFLPTETGLRGWAYRTRTRKCRFDPARFASVPSRRPRKVSDTKMLCKPKEFARDYKKPTFPSSSPTWPARQCCLFGLCPVCKNTCDIPESYSLCRRGPSPSHAGCNSLEVLDKH